MARLWRVTKRLLILIWWPIDRILCVLLDAFIWFNDVTTPESLKKPSKVKKLWVDRRLPTEFEVDIIVSKKEHSKRSTNDEGSHIKVRINGGRQR